MFNPFMLRKVLGWADRTSRLADVRICRTPRARRENTGVDRADQHRQELVAHPGS